jgi:hypothetical protein
MPLIRMSKLSNRVNILIILDLFKDFIYLIYIINEK